MFIKPIISIAVGAFIVAGGVVINGLFVKRLDELKAKYGVSTCKEALAKAANEMRQKSNSQKTES
jgi:hypothetical protein